MAYDKEKDHLLWQSEQSESGLVARVYQYGDRGKPKLGFVRLYEDYEGEIKEKNGGRLDMSDLKFFGAIYPDVNKAMKAALNGEQQEFVYDDEIDPDDAISESGTSVYDLEIEEDE